jgi:hypothetical protein
MPRQKKNKFQIGDIVEYNNHTTWLLLSKHKLGDSRDIYSCYVIRASGILYKEYEHRIAQHTEEFLEKWCKKIA